MNPSVQYSNYPPNPIQSQSIQNAPSPAPVVRKVTPARKAVGAVAAAASTPGQPLPLQQRNSVSGSSISSQPGANTHPNLATHRASISSFSSASSNAPTRTDLPPGWEVLYTPDGKPYYSNHITKATTWTKPEINPAPIPPGWEERKTPDGKVYYCHAPTQKTQWERPVAATIQQEKIPVSSAQPTVYPIKAELAHTVDTLPPHWEERKTAEGKVYYCNTLAQTTQWERPKTVPQPQQTRAVSTPVVGTPQTQQTRPFSSVQQPVPTVTTNPSPHTGQQRVHNAQVTPRPLAHAQTTTSVPTRNTVQQNLAGPQPRLAPIITSTQNALPPGWEERRTKEGKVYYCNVPAQTTQWERPPTPTQPLFTTQKQVVSPQPHQVLPQPVISGQPQISIPPTQRVANQQPQQFSTQKQVVSPTLTHVQPQATSSIQTQVPSVQQQQTALPQQLPQSQQFSTQKQVVSPILAHSQPQATRSIQTQVPGVQQPLSTAQHVQQPLAAVAIPNVQATKIVQPHVQNQLHSNVQIQTSTVSEQNQSPIVSPLSAQPQQVQSAPVALWEVRQTIEGDPYFYNTHTKVATWELPPQSSGYFAVIPQAHIVPEHLIPPEHVTQSPQTQTISAQPAQQPIAPSLPPGWEERRTAEGKVYYCNVPAQTTQWEHPTASLTQTTSQTSAASSSVANPTDAQQIKNNRRKSTFGLGALSSSKTMQKMKMPASAKAMTESSMKGLKSAGKYVKNNKGKVLGVAAGAGLASVLLKETLGIDFDLGLGEDGGEDFGGGEEVVVAEEAPPEEAAPVEQHYYEPAPVEQQVYEPVPYEQQVYEPAPYEQQVYEPAPVEQQVYEPAPVEQQVYEPAPVEQQVYEPVPYEQQVYEPAPFDQQAYEPVPMEQQVYEPVPYEQQTFESAPVEEPIQEPVPIEQQVYEPVPFEQQTFESAPVEEPVYAAQPYEEVAPFQEPVPQEEVVFAEEPAPHEEQVVSEEQPPAEETPPQEESAQEQPPQEQAGQEEVQEEPPQEQAQEQSTQQEPPPQETVPAEEQPPQEQAAEDSDAQSEAESEAESAAEEAAEQQEEQERAAEDSDAQSEAESEAESAAEEAAEQQEEANEAYQEALEEQHETVHNIYSGAGYGDEGAGNNVIYNESAPIIGGGNDQAAYITGGETVDYSSNMDALHAQQMMEAQGSQNAAALI